jgi:UDP-N-acetylmuramoyl-tripeptide--D-alanyl-D-alanine ligase
MTTITDLYSKFVESSSVCTDTRKIESNCLFFALKGDNFDGNLYADEALEKGASLAVIDNPDQQGDRKILVENVLTALQDLAHFHRKQLKLPIVAITGSNGKTTTKKLVSEVLSKRFKVRATKGNLNNHIGVPLTLLSFTAELDLGIVEMGANHQKEIESLCKIAEPNYGYITNFGKAHLEGFRGIEGVIKGKSELYDYLIHHDGLIFFNRDDDIQVKKAVNFKNYSIGEKPLSDCRVTFMKANPFVELEYSHLQIKSQLIGEYNFKNIAAAIGIGRYFGVGRDKIKEAIENFEPEEMRSQVIEKNDLKILLDAYNANPTSMKAALDSFKKMSATSHTVILGDMFEIGETTLEEHRQILKICEALNFDSILVCGEHFSEASKGFENISSFKTTTDLTAFISKNKPKASSFILIKGSRGMQLETLMDAF